MPRYLVPKSTWKAALAGTAFLLGATILTAQQKPSATASRPAHESATSSPATGREWEPTREPSPSEILRELSKQDRTAPRPVIRPTVPGQTTRVEPAPEAMPPNAVVPIHRKLLPDGHRLVDRPGRLTREGEYYTFSFETRTEGVPELPIRLLPNRLLEDMEMVSAGGAKPVVFLVSGEATEYHGVNYLLIQKLLTRPELGNLK